MPRKQAEVNQVDSANEFLCAATFFTVGKWRHVIPFLRMSSRGQKQLKESPGLVRYGLLMDLTNLLRKQYISVSVWTDRSSMRAFVRGEPHAEAVKRMQESAGDDFAFAEWTNAEGSINWNEVMAQLMTPNYNYRKTGARTSNES